MVDPFVLKWASQRLEKLLGQDMSDVCEYLVSIEDESELDAFVSGMLGEDAPAFIADLKQTRTAAAAMTDSGRVAAESDAAVSTRRQGQLSVGGSGKGAGGGGGGGYMTGSSADRRMSKSGAKNLRDLAGSKAREAEEAEARLTRNLQLAGGASAGGKVDLALADAFAEEGMTAYVKAEELDAFGIASMKKDPKKKRCGQLQDTRSGENSPRAGVGCDVAPDTERVHKVKMSRAERAQLLQSDAAFLAPGRHVTTWVGNGSEYTLVGNCLDCGKILSNQEGEGACLICGSEQVYLAGTNAMLDGTPIDQAIMAKRRRGGGGVGDVDEVDAQLLDRNADEDLAFLRALDLRDRYTHTHTHTHTCTYIDR